MAVEFKLPEIGEGVMEGEIVEWHVGVGDVVASDQPLVSMLTDKATVEINSPQDGTIAALFGEPGDVVNVGDVMIHFSDGAGAAPPVETPAPKTDSEAGTPKAGAGQVVDFKLPEIGEGVMEGEIVEWHVKAGDQVEHDQPMVSMLTDKATVEIHAPYHCVVVETFGSAGDVVEVGTVLARLQGEAGSAEVPAAAAAASPAPTPQAAPAAKAAPKPAPTPSVAVEDNPSISAFGTPLATPHVRKLAVEKGVDLRHVVGTGPNNRITKKDVEGALGGSVPQPRAAATASAPPPVPKAPPLNVPEELVTREKLKGMRKAIYSSMARSKQIIPHFTYVDEVEMDKLVQIRSELKAAAESEGVKLTYLPFITKAVVFALQKFPIMNASVDDEAGEIVYKNYHNIGIATATEYGLTVPVVKHAGHKSIIALAREIAELSSRAQNRKSTTDDISGGTFTITSLGRLGGLLATPIINHPEVAIFSVHNIQERAVVRNGQIVVRQMMNIAVAFDHRVIDGDVGASFAQEVKSYLEEPSKLFLKMV